MRGHVTNEMDVVGASADEIWAVYGSKDLPKLIITLQPGVFEKIDYVEGDGGQGTILHIVMAQGTLYLLQLISTSTSLSLLQNILA